jgi:hypothetical protein
MAYTDVYTENKFSVLQQTRLAGTGGKLTINGTQSSEAVIERMTFLCNAKVVSASLWALVGGTAAAWNAVSLGKSVAGTGTASLFGTFSFSTNADNTKINASLTATAFSSGDVLVIATIAGTAASAGAIGVIDLGWKQNYVSGS